MKATDSVKRYRAVTDVRARLGQVMTPPLLADAVVRLLGVRGGNWLELGSGSGRLAEAVRNGADPHSYVGVELESAMIGLCSSWPGFRYVQQDVLATGSLAKALEQQMFDSVIGNPPYGMQAFSAEAKARLQSLCPELNLQGSWAPVDLYFVLESLARLKSDGAAAFIVGADIPCGLQSMPFRRLLLEMASEVECYELPQFAFGRAYAEVQAYVLIARYGRRPLTHVTLGRMDEELRLSSLRKIVPSHAIESMDIGHHEFQEMDEALRRSSDGITLRDLGVSIVRGSRTRSQFAQLGIQHFHTSDFPKSGMEISLEGASGEGYQQAIVGDILLPRVGTRCLEHKAVVVEGQSPFSEAVFRLRAPSKHQERLVRWMTSGECTSWRRAAARGACAKHLTVGTLLSMPVPA